jgi:hypothetical protein
MTLMKRSRKQFSLRLLISALTISGLVCALVFSVITKRHIAHRNMLSVEEFFNDYMCVAKRELRDRYGAANVFVSGSGSEGEASLLGLSSSWTFAFQIKEKVPSNSFRQTENIDIIVQLIYKTPAFGSPFLEIISFNEESHRYSKQIAEHLAVDKGLATLPVHRIRDRPSQ